MGWRPDLEKRWTWISAAHERRERLTCGVEHDDRRVNRATRGVECAAASAAASHHREPRLMRSLLLLGNYPNVKQ
jgi:hypothetical protein